MPWQEPLEEMREWVRHELAHQQRQNRYLLATVAIALLVALAGLGIGGWVWVRSVNDKVARTEQRCEDRREARQAVRALVLVVTTPHDTYQPKPDNPLVQYLDRTLAPGGALEEIKCVDGG